MDVPVALPRSSARFRPDGEGLSRAVTLQEIRALSHYRPDYDYCPERYRYTEWETTDPHYVVFQVRMMSPTREHGEAMVHMRNALQVLVRSAAAPEVHVSLDVDIAGIPGDFFAGPRHTSTLRPDLSLWAGPPPARPLSSYRYDRDGAPLLVVEVVSHSDAEVRDNDWQIKMETYARMGVREYWIVDEQLEDTLQGFTLDGADGVPRSLARYRAIAADAAGGRASAVLGASLRWGEGDVQRWHEDWGTWVRAVHIPVMEAELKTWGRLLHRILDAAAPGAAEQVLRHWAQRVPSAWPSDETLDRLEAAPAQWRSLLLGKPSSPDDGTG